MIWFIISSTLRWCHFLFPFCSSFKFFFPASSSSSSNCWLWATNVVLLVSGRNLGSCLPSGFFLSLLRYCITLLDHYSGMDIQILRIDSSTSLLLIAFSVRSLLQNVSQKAFSFVVSIWSGHLLAPKSLRYCLPLVTLGRQFELVGDDLYLVKFVSYEAWPLYHIVSEGRLSFLVAIG